MGSRIYDRSRLYDFFLAVASRYIHRSFRHYKCLGKENIPTDGALIFASNHCDALMDPLAVLALDSSTKVFVSRADIFSNPVAQKILTFMKILPIHRMRDGLRNVIKTEETIEKSIEVIENDVCFCIFPEGRHRAKHSLLPFGKGLSRIAYGAHCRIGAQKPVYIVPIGCEYGDYFRYRSTLLLNIGKPVNVSEYVSRNKDLSENELLLGIKDLATEAIRDQIVYIPDDQDYEPVWSLTKSATGRIHRRRLKERFDANRKTVVRILKLKEENPVKAASLFARARSFEKERISRKISINAFSSGNTMLRLLKLNALMVLLFPLFAAAAAFSLPTWLTAELVAVRAKDPAFRNSLRCAVITLLWSWLLIFAFIPAPFFTYDYFELSRQTASAWRAMFAKKLHKEYETLCSTVDSLPVGD